jgi:hypothetical protein
VMQERVLDDGAQRTVLPLVSVVGSSHAPPADMDTLGALFDRFLIRKYVRPVTTKRRMQLLADEAAPPSAGDEHEHEHEHEHEREHERAGFTLEELSSIRAAAVQEVVLRPEIAHVLTTLPEALQAAAAGSTHSEAELPADGASHGAGPGFGEGGVAAACPADRVVSDRRLASVGRLLRVAALTSGRREVSLHDCLLLRHVFWREPAEQARIDEWLGSQLRRAEALSAQLRLEGVLHEALELSSGGWALCCGCFDWDLPTCRVFLSICMYTHFENKGVERPGQPRRTVVGGRRTTCCAPPSAGGCWSSFCFRSGRRWSSVAST